MKERERNKRLMIFFKKNILNNYGITYIIADRKTSTNNI